jgi:heme/copper-type cytochrome/quinol oxidase subunit 3
VSAQADERETMARASNVAGQLLASALAFFFLSFVFAYFYLRSLNNAHLWRPKGIQPPVGTGAAVAVLVVLSAVAVWLAAHGKGNRAAMLGVGLTLGVAALVVQIVEWFTIGFGPGNGGYASVFVGWTGFYFLVAALTLIWVEIQLATALRAGPGADDDPGLRPVAFFWAFIAGIGVLTWIILYTL